MLISLLASASLFGHSNLGILGGREGGGECGELLLGGYYGDSDDNTDSGEGFL